MDRQQFATLAIGIKSAYPASKILEDKASMDFWYTMLMDLPYEVAENAAMEHISTSTFPPSIAEIRKLCIDRIKAPALSFDEAWGVVQKAISAFGYYNSEQAYGTMDELTLATVKNLGWSRLCLSENPAADRANFREAYEARVAAQRNKSQLPEFVSKKKEQLQARYIPAIEEKEAPQLGTSEPARAVKADLTEDQMAERARMYEEARRRLIGGEIKAE